MLDLLTDSLKALGLPWEIITITLFWLTFLVGWGIVIGLIFWLCFRVKRRPSLRHD